MAVCDRGRVDRRKWFHELKDAKYFVNVATRKVRRMPAVVKSIPIQHGGWVYSHALWLPQWILLVEMRSYRNQWFWKVFIFNEVCYDWTLSQHAICNSCAFVKVSFFRFLFSEWCYTTKRSTQEYAYVKCDEDSNCCPCLKCAASCTI